MKSGSTPISNNDFNVLSPHIIIKFSLYSFNKCIFLSKDGPADTIIADLPLYKSFILFIGILFIILLRLLT